MHIYDSNRKKKTHKRNWINSLKKQGLKPDIILLHDNVYNLDKILELEIKYIKEYKENGSSLTNSTNGGEKNKEFTKEIKEKIR